MAKKKRHHYVPKFYLRRFSINEEGIFLGLYNINNERFIQNAPLKRQAYENYLYGEDDEIENALADMEGNISQMFNFWTDENLLYPPPPESNGFKLLKRFILYQAFRIPKSGNDIMDKLNDALKTVLKEFKPDLWDDIKDGSFVHESPVLFGLANAIENEHLLDYLDCKFLVNYSLLPFITSDAPVVFYNQLMEQTENYMGATALVAKGLQIFYPIHPRLMICLYDSNVYEFGNNCDNYCSTESIDEVHQLNGLQLINSKSQVFFNDLISEEYIQELCKHFEEYRGTSKNINKIINRGNRKFFLTSSEDAHINLELDFFKLKVNPKDYKNDFESVRHSSFVRPPIRKISLDN
ncbi:DUF4238 domain-containing protein [Elizabethkingia anophelis]|uniref:DUF4238 domain-containing protein n=1 Tax=Elizabethkingia anophelis TaxID=1117645 RepID=UPI000999B929|nr:DUF4238 domain-containing protein [Elizabethkingia anophelis]ELB0066876.1 DUF4238 domain-containing protein [Elizabethkingia anophelis]ELB1891570.1 DUF4238 domain-containing protein [Elizabethkingia anophelis]MDV2442300.1 DUF4238 domain-containing protein [Elizabethkingia anophelis]MDV3893456.1 DUF4238 domain-containing protein [Elizabethkingia anophelis]MDV3915789.1 DUF4238 domain-containing protein [Elizabethkingia anophelis]